MIDDQELDARLGRAAADVRSAFDELELPAPPATRSRSGARLLAVAAAAAIAIFGFGALQSNLATPGLVVETRTVEAPVELAEPPEVEVPAELVGPTEALPDVPEPAAPVAPIPEADDEDEDLCFGRADDELGTAQDNYTADCGIEYSSTSGLHQCEWDAEDKWRCNGPSLASLNAKPAAEDPSAGVVRSEEPPDSTQVPDTAAAPPANPGADTELCFGNDEPDLDAAEDSYTIECGIEYSSTSGLHKCNWSEDGWRCQGPRVEDASAEPAAEELQRSAPVPEDSAPQPVETDRCSGEVDTNIVVAKDNYTVACGVEYSDSSGLHQCEWTPEGWLCKGPASG